VERGSEQQQGRRRVFEEMEFMVMLMLMNVVMFGMKVQGT
jgi:hypothetical protein